MIMQRCHRPPAVLATAALALLGFSCRPAEGPEGDAAAGQTYTVRGEVTAVPGEGMPDGQVRIHHEAIPDFVDYDGETVGMASMAMPFPAGEGVELAGLAPGDKIQFVLEVTWEGSPPYQITRIERLPPETDLDFGQSEEVATFQSMPGTSPTPP